MALLFLCLTLAPSALALVQVDYEVVCDSATEYYDTAALECISCTEGCNDDTDDPSNAVCNKEPDFTMVDFYGNALGCKCSLGYKRIWALDQDTCTTSDYQSASCTGFSCASCLNGNDDDLEYPNPFEKNENAVAYNDGDSCALCGDTTNGISGDDCGCPTNHVLTEVDDGLGYVINKTCTACTDGTAVITSDASIAGVNFYATDYQCQRCPDPHMTFDSAGTTCTCDDDYTKTGQSLYGQQSCVYTEHSDAIKQSYAETSASTVNFFKIQADQESSPSGELEMESLVMKHHFLNASTNCFYYNGPENIANCQTLANLCVMQMYWPDSEVCELFEDILDKRSENARSQDGWVDTLPWLRYVETATEIRVSEAITMQMSFGNVDDYHYHQMRYVLSKYYLNGTWMGYEDLTTQFYYCGMAAPNTHRGGGSSMSTSWLRFGHGYNNNFECDLETLMADEPMFYELFLIDEETGDMMPVPVLLRDYRDSGLNFINVNYEDAEESNDVFVRRFMLYDTLSGVSDSSTTNDDGTYIPDVIRYANKITLSVQIQDTSAGKIYPPILELSYKEREVSYWDSDSTMKRDFIFFRAEYSMKVSNYEDVVIAFFSVACVLAGITWTMRVNNWSRRNVRMRAANSHTNMEGRLRGADGLNSGGGRAGPPSMGRQPDDSGYSSFWYLWCVFMILIHCLVIYFFPFIFFLCTYWFVFFKMQDTVYVMLPPSNNFENEDDDYYIIWVLIYLCFFCQSTWIIHLIYGQCTCDVFFIDYERPHGKDRAETPVSVWRTIFAANEWNELQTSRPTSLSFTLFVITMVLVGWKREYLATPQPNMNDFTEGDLNMILRFANTTWWFVVLELFQLGFNWVMIYFGREPKDQLFIDFCTMAKISVLVLDERYHGYYLHCDSPHAHADTDMATLTERLLAEESGHSTARGIPVLGDREEYRDIQCFDIYLTNGWSIWFNSIRSFLEREAREAGPKSTSGGGKDMPAYRAQQRQSRSFLRNSTTLRDRHAHLEVGAMEIINKGLRMFISQGLKNDLFWDVSPPQSLFGALIKTPPPDISASSAYNVLTPDRLHRYTCTGTYAYAGVHFYGIEWDLWLHNALTFAMFDFWFKDTATSVVCTWAIYQILRFFRGYFGTANLANRTLVDSTFLI